MPLESYTSVVGGKPALEAEEDISFTADRTQLFLTTDKTEGLGTLYITNKHVIWQSLDGNSGYRMDYPYILLHAVCRDVSSFPHPCLYAQLDEELAEDAHEEMQATLRQQMPTEDDEEEKNDGEEDDEEESPSPSTISDLRFVPENPDILDSLWSAMSACAALNPDEDLSDGEGDFLFDADEIRGGAYGAEDDYGEGGEDVSSYDEATTESRMRGLQMGGSAEEGIYDDAEEDGIYDDADEDVVEDPLHTKSKSPASDAAVAAQLAVAAAQVEAATASAPGKKRDREDQTEAQQ